MHVDVPVNIVSKGAIDRIGRRVVHGQPGGGVKNLSRNQGFRGGRRCLWRAGVSLHDPHFESRHVRIHRSGGSGQRRRNGLGGGQLQAGKDRQAREHGFQGDRMFHISIWIGWCLEFGPCLRHRVEFRGKGSWFYTNRGGKQACPPKGEIQRRQPSRTSCASFSSLISVVLPCDSERPTSHYHLKTAGVPQTLVAARMFSYRELHLFKALFVKSGNNNCASAELL